MIKLTDPEFLEIMHYVKSHYGVNLENKSTLIEGRLGYHIYSHGYGSFAEYFDFVKSDTSGQELAYMIAKLTTNHTFFLREEEHFSFFSKEVLPWIDNDLSDRDLRIWCAGCSTGPEPYTISMVMLDHYENAHNRTDTVILATDISEKVLNSAQDGIYTEEELAQVPGRWKDKYFIRNDDYSWRVNKKLRSNVAFKRHNLLDPIGAKKPFHVIFCRNVMIYFDGPTKEALVDRIYDALLPGAYFFIGMSEAPSILEHRFQYIKPSVYRKPLE